MSEDTSKTGASSNGAIRIVVGVDFTEVGDVALDKAIRYARRLETSELHPVFVITERVKNHLEEVNRHLDEAYKALRKRVVDHCEALAEQWEQHIFFHVRLSKEPAEAIHQVAIDVDADAIFVGTHGRRGVQKMLLGSVAEQLVRTAHVPVMVARPNELSELEKTPKPEPAVPGEDIHHARVMATEHIAFGKRPSHIAYLI